VSEHDHSYKLLFSHPQMVRDLLEGFIPGDWLSQLDYDSLEKVSCSYISDDLRERSDQEPATARGGPPAAGVAHRALQRLGALERVT
jgi:hypothetical protein